MLWNNSKVLWISIVQSAGSTVSLLLIRMPIPQTRTTGITYSPFYFTVPEKEPMKQFLFLERIKVFSKRLGRFRHLLISYFLIFESIARFLATNINDKPDRMRTPDQIEKRTKLWGKNRWPHH